MPPPVVTSALVRAGGSLLGNVLGGIFSAKSARKQNAMAIAEAQKQRDFQERMSSTAYQRSATDLQKAGLNRILALGSPSSSPGGASAPIVGELEGAATSARSAAMDVANILNVRANTAFTQQKTKALAPAAEVGETAAGAITWAKQKLTSGIDYKSLGRELMNELKGEGHTAKALAAKFRTTMSQIRDWYSGQGRADRKGIVNLNVIGKKNR